MKRKSNKDNGLSLVVSFAILLGVIIILLLLLFFFVMKKPKNDDEVAKDITTESVQTEATETRVPEFTIVQNETEIETETEATEEDTQETSDTPVLDSIKINEDGTRAEPLEEKPNALLDITDLAVKTAEIEDTSFVIEGYDGYMCGNVLAERMLSEFGYTSVRCVNSFEMNHDTLQQIVYRIIFDEDESKRYFFYVSKDGCWAALCDMEPMSEWE